MSFNLSSCVFSGHIYICHGNIWSSKSRRNCNNMSEYSRNMFLFPYVLGLISKRLFMCLFRKGLLRYDCYQRLYSLVQRFYAWNIKNMFIVFNQVNINTSTECLRSRGIVINWQFYIYTWKIIFFIWIIVMSQKNIRFWN